MLSIVRTCRSLSCILLIAAVGCTPEANEEVPPFVARLISKITSEPKSNPPASIWRYSYEGNVVFYVPPACCDVPSVLYASDGSIICGPDGGITGTGDGKCPDFFDTRTNGKRIWSDGR